MAGAIANDGQMVKPFLVRSVRSDSGARLYLANTEKLAMAVRPQTADALRKMMHQTVQSGTSRVTFRTLLRNSRFQSVEFGGKTGSMTNMDPRAKCDWFVGYGRNDSERISVAVVTLHKDTWRVKSSYVARALLEDFFSRKLPPLAHRR